MTPRVRDPIELKQDLLQTVRKMQGPQVIAEKHTRRK